MSSGGVGGTGGGGTGAIPTPSSFNLLAPGFSKTGVLTFRLNAPAAGRFAAVATTILPTRPGAHRTKHRHKPKRISYGRATVVAVNAGLVRLVLRPSGPVKAALAKGERLTVLITITFTTSGGVSTTHRITVTFKGPKPKAKTRR